MKNFRYFLLAIVTGCTALTGHAQTPGWKPLKVGNISLRYPPNWQLDSAGNGDQMGITMTPDSMRDLNMRVCVIFRLSADSSRDYGYIKKNFMAMIESSIGPDAYFLRTVDTTLKNHKTMYAEATLRALPMKIYGFSVGAYNYIFLFTLRRHFQVADPRLERDEAAILNSISFDH